MRHYYHSKKKINSTSGLSQQKLINCPDCEKEISARANACPHCGCPLNMTNTESIKRILPTFLFLLFLGGLGAHRFYVGKIGTGIALIVLLIIGTISSLTIVWIIFGIWLVVDFIQIVSGFFEDEEGLAIKKWT